MHYRYLQDKLREEVYSATKPTIALVVKLGDARS
jgi:hypothetical protein